MALPRLSQQRNRQMIPMDRIRRGTQWHLGLNKIDNLIHMMSLNVDHQPGSRSPCAQPRNVSPESNPAMLVKK
jgi:hypothetical protein